MMDLYDSNSTNLFICAISLIKYIEEKILLDARAVIKKSPVLTKRQKECLGDFWKGKNKPFGMFLNEDSEIGKRGQE
jgi:hypothetical protein